MGQIPRLLKFTHRTNADGSTHSYCSRCLVTVADSRSGAEVASAEKQHRCDPKLLELLTEYKKVSHLRSAA
jgi:hypothetical protein